jgi:MFS family permease
VRRTRHLRPLLGQASFRRLLAVRLAGQFGDGVFQASLAGAVLFNPERQASAADLAAGFAVLLLPYSFVGPFAGVLLDRWWRQRVLVFSNVARAGMGVGVGVALFGGLHGQPLYASALVVLSLSRFVLSALSAALPHLVSALELPTANAVSTTSGAIATALGSGLAIVVRTPIGNGSHAYAVVAASSALCYLAAAACARGFGLRDLGPDAVERGQRETVAAVARGLLEGGRHVRSRRPAYDALLVIGVQRLGYGVTTVCALLLYRNYFHNEGPLRVGAGGLAQLVTAVAVGGGLAALVTPAAVRRWGVGRWPAALLFLGAVVQVTLVLSYQLPLVLCAALLVGLCSQGIKITVDTIVQRCVDDEFRGRVFALYDTMFNFALVIAAVLTAVVLPENGRSPASVVVIAAGYAVAAVWYLRRYRTAGLQLIVASPAAQVD